MTERLKSITNTVLWKWQYEPQGIYKDTGINGVYFDHHGSKHDIYKHKETGKMIPIPRHTEFSNEFLKDVLKEIPR